VLVVGCEAANLGSVEEARDHVADPADLAIRCWVDGEPRPDSNTKDMIFSAAYLVWHLSQVCDRRPLM
jgi:2,4-didehydro-3-deoxy-L-rhamnonate hydrolase